MGYDPTGCWDWGGVIVGLGIIVGTVITVATFGVASPLGVLVVGATITTGVVTTYAAATDAVMTVDLSISIPVFNAKYVKIGTSIVVDFNADEIHAYSHKGGGFGITSGLSYSAGIVTNYDEPNDYSGPFTDVFFGPTDHCWTPQDGIVRSTQANCVSFSTGIGFGVGYDHYSKPIPLFQW